MENNINNIKKNMEEQQAKYAQQVEEGKRNFTEALNELAKVDPESGELNEIASLLSLPEDQFAIIAPFFIEELEKSLNNPNDQLGMIQALNIAGLRIDDIKDNFEKIIDELEKELAGIISVQKQNFIKKVLAISYNSVAEADGITKRVILIPIQYCNKEAKMPTYAHLTDAGMDVYAVEDITINPGETKLLPIGVKVALPLGYELQVRPKSGRSLKSKLRIANTPGTIDSGYRDEIGIIVDNIEPFIKSAKINEDGTITEVEYGKSYTIEKGEKIAQLVLNEVPKARFYEVDDVKAYGEDRKGGFGSTGLRDIPKK